MTQFAVEVDNKGFRPCSRLNECLHHPKINIFMTLNGFPKFDLNIIVKLLKLYTTICLEVTLIPLVVEPNEGAQK
jgi:hypothetical protein